MKNNIPSDYEVKFTLSEVQNWNFYSFIKRVVEKQGFYTCMYMEKKTLITA